MEGLDKQLNAKLDGKPGHLALTAHTIVTIGTILAVLLATLAIAGDQFNGGMSAQGALTQQSVESERKQAELEARLDALTKEIRALRRDHGFVDYE